MNFFSKIVDFINSFYNKRPGRKKNMERESRFLDISRELKAASQSTDEVERAILLCDEALDIVSDKIILSNRLKIVEDKLSEVASFHNMTDDETQDLKDMIARYRSLSKDSNTLKYQVTSFDASLTRMESLAGDAPKAVNEIKFAEERQRIFKKDISYLQGEKMVLEHENERLQNAIDFVYKFSIALVIFFAGMSVLMVFLYIFQNMQTMLVMTVMLIAIIVISALLYALRIRLKQEMRINFLKQKRAVELLNKKTAVYAHFTNFLNYEYKKFKVRSSDMLKTNLEDYNHYKHLTKRLDAIRNAMNQQERNLEYFLREKGVKANYSNMERFAANINIDDKKYAAREIAKEKGLIEATLKKLDMRHSEIWDTLQELNKNDKTAENTIDRIIQAYTEKAGDELKTAESESEQTMVVPLNEEFDEEIEELEVFGEIISPEE